MSGQIRMTPEQMRTRSGEVSNEGDKFQEVINKMQGIINELRHEWDGKASEAFEAQFNQLKPSFNNMRELIDDISKQLRETALAVEELDQKIAGKFGVK
jgi:WXG100 family type VII secretion target